MPIIEYDQPDRFVTGTVGPPGGRTFFLQVAQGRRITSVSLEKQQVQVLAERVNDLLTEMGTGADVPELPEDNEPLSTPIEDEFRVGTLSLAWQEDRNSIVIECHDGQVELEEADDGEAIVEVIDPDAMLLRIAVAPEVAREFARRSLAAISQGRPPCPFCGGPLDPQGHICPRANGYRR